MHSTIRPNSHVALRLPSGISKVIEITPNTTINLGKYGTFSSNLLLGRPYYLTFELLDKEDGKSRTELRVVPASELHVEVLGNGHAPTAEASDEPAEGGPEFDIVGENGEVIMRNNRLTVDDPSRQKLSMAEIEELKKAGAGSGKEIIAKIMGSHEAIEEKTSFSLAKYTLRKSRKYLKRFTVLPMDVGMLTEYITERESHRVMELREESLGLICSWANVHHGGASRVLTAEDGLSQIGGARWLVVDDTGGLVTTALAEKMGILYPDEDDDQNLTAEEKDAGAKEGGEPIQTTNGTTTSTNLEENGDTVMAEPEPEGESTTQPQQQHTAIDAPSDPQPRPRRPPRPHIPQMSATTNTLTILHPNNQPNLSYLKYFSFDTGAPTTSHPLYKHLKSLSWLQLLSPEDDPSYSEPEALTDEMLAGMKSSKRGNYYKKRRRWERTTRLVEETRRGGFDGLVVASTMEPKTILKELVPLVRGGGRVVVYSPNAEPLVELCDYYSKERRTAYVARQFDSQNNRSNNGSSKVKRERDHADDMYAASTDAGDEDDDFPVNPTLLLAPSLQTARARQWQVLPGRTHPVMTSRGGAEGYLFTATRVLPFEGKVEARGHQRGKRRKTAATAETAAPE
ncbi:eukaryotic translation initiation factor 3, gamma subunit [Massariosphaeria phaeospora]|uniref:tRNA (adenine(58)-N(1))-methyltransferase non-catalytic subunit TRM6 n=1 Tax=Massariosphaeria phaeospora TaxID=100035 RepID=A0A7C8MAN6_9PLEO|nr:eukaryotic translation initiation factor 3, gamma subunit [Massariosphaeria phaeospora]